MIEKRKNPALSEHEMYNMSDLKQAILKERRKDELDKLNEVRQQKRVWLRTVLSTAILVLLFILCAIYGAIR